MLSPRQSQVDLPDINYDINDLTLIKISDIGLLIKSIKF
jgi:hypothetical protein